MFRWNHQYSIEVELPLHAVWDFYTNPSNWPISDDRVEAFILEGEFKPGSQIKAAIKNTSAHLGVLITEVKPYCEYRTLIRNLFQREESVSTFQEITPEKTRITYQTYVLSPFTPFIKSTMLRRVEKAHSIWMEALTELRNKMLIVK